MDKREQAIADCKVLWKYLAQSGRIDKWEAVRELFEQGRISKAEYRCDCPLCEQFITELRDCPKCPWPKEYKYIRDFSPRCVYDVLSPYNEWHYNPLSDRKLSQKLASAVYQLVKTFK